jgi:hypothetical protein
VSRTRPAPLTRRRHIDRRAIIAWQEKFTANCLHSANARAGRRPLRHGRRSACSSGRVSCASAERLPGWMDVTFEVSGPCSHFPARPSRPGGSGRSDERGCRVCASRWLDHGLDAAFSDDAGGGLIVPGCLASQFRKPHPRNPGRVVAGRERAAARREVDRGGDSRVAVRLI